MSGNQRVLIHGTGPRLPLLVERLAQRNLPIDLLTSIPDAAAHDLAARGLVRLVPSADPWTYAEVHRCEAPAVAAEQPPQTKRDDAAARQEHTDSPDAEGVGVASRPCPGRVVVVGGGPGSPGLITVGGLAALYAADVILCDRLVPLGLLDSLPGSVEIIHVGKIPHGEFTAQEVINELLITHARAGRVVVRLKGGDGYVFGRGGEEVLACRQASVLVEVIPGVSSAVAVPALAGIPVTHRGLTQGFVVVSGHVPPGDSRSTTNWRALAESGLTLVVLMGVGHLPEITRELMAAGLSPMTPAAVISQGASPRQRTVTGTVQDIAEATTAAHLTTPAVIVLGDVVTLLKEAGTA